MRLLRALVALLVITFFVGTVGYLAWAQQAPEPPLTCEQRLAGIQNVYSGAARRAEQAEFREGILQQDLTTAQARIRELEKQMADSGKAEKNVEKPVVPSQGGGG